MQFSQYSQETKAFLASSFIMFYSFPLVSLTLVLPAVVVTLEPCEGADTYVNGKKVTEPSILRSGRLHIGVGGHNWEVEVTGGRSLKRHWQEKEAVVSHYISLLPYRSICVWAMIFRGGFSDTIAMMEGDHLY